MENVGIFYDHLVHCTAIGNILWPFGICMYLEVIWYIFPRFGILYQEKSGNPAADRVGVFPTSKSTRRSSSSKTLAGSDLEIGGFNTKKLIIKSVVFIPKN
jgi:hypothetical protein